MNQVVNETLRKDGAPAFGTPEYMRTAMVGGQLARRYKVPYRSSNVSAANALDGNGDKLRSTLARVIDRTVGFHCASDYGSAEDARIAIAKVKELIAGAADGG